MEDIFDNLEEPDLILKIIMVGNAAVGKTNLVERYTKNEFEDETKPTIGVDFAMSKMTIKKNKVTTHIWDTAGQEKYRSTMVSYYQQAHGIVLVYDITERESFEALKHWLEIIQDNCVPETKIMIVGNKSDLKEERVVSLQEGIDYAETQNCFFMETSAKDNSDGNVEKAFEELIIYLANIHIPKTKEQIEAIKPLRADLFHEDYRLQKKGCC